jgi:hypothetical protein
MELSQQMTLSVEESIDLLCASPEDSILGFIGPPGFGKSSIPQQAAKRLNQAYRCLYLALMEVVEINGVPHLVNKSTGEVVGKWAPFDNLFPLAHEEHPKTILNLDDLGQATPGVTKGGIRIAYGDGLDRMVGQHKLHPNVRVCFTANSHLHRSGAHRLEAYVQNRCCLIHVEPNPLEWVTWYLAHNGNPRIAGWIRFTKTVTDFAPEKDAFMSPRSLVKLGEMLDALAAAGVNGRIHRAVAYGIIGEQAGSGFLAYDALSDGLPDMDAVLRGDKVKLPERAEVQYMFAAAVLQATKEKHVPLVAQLITDMTKVGGTGFEVAAFLTFEALKGGASHLRAIRTQTSLYKWLGEYGKYLP